MSHWFCEDEDQGLPRAPVSKYNYEVTNSQQRRADEEIVHDKGEGEGGGVGEVAEEHGGGGFREAMLGQERDKAKLG